MWDGTEEQTVIVRKAITSLGVSKGSAISYDWNAENELTNVAPIGTVGALTYANDGQVKIGTAGYELADDVTIINVSTKDQAKVEGNNIAYAAQTDVEGIYYNNCWYVYDSADKEIDLLIIDVTSNKLVGTGAGTVAVGSNLTVNDIKNAPDGMYYPTNIGSLPAGVTSITDVVIFKFDANATSQTYTLSIGTTEGGSELYTETSPNFADNAGHFFYVKTGGTKGNVVNGVTETGALTSKTTYYWQVTADTDNEVVASGSFVAP